MQLLLGAAAGMGAIACSRPTMPPASTDSGAPQDASAPDATSDSLPTPTEWTSADLPSLGGAPDTHDGRVIAALCDTVVPGKHRDPNGTLGALDVNAPEMFFDTRLPAAPVVPLVVALLDGQAKKDYGGRAFDALTPAERDLVLSEILISIDIFEFAVQLVKLATFTAENMGKSLGYPGPNGGYFNHPDFSFRQALAKPHPLTIDGNLP